MIHVALFGIEAGLGVVLTYLVHSAVWILGALLLARLQRALSPAARHMLWRAALIGPLASSALALGVGHRWQWSPTAVSPVVEAMVAMKTAGRRSHWLRARWSIGVVALSVGVLLGGCAKVNVVPLGAMRDGRHQYEVECNKLASHNGACHEQALKACGGEYETLDVHKTAPAAKSLDGQNLSAQRYRVLLIACNR